MSGKQGMTWEDIMVTPVACLNPCAGWGNDHSRENWGMDIPA